MNKLDDIKNRFFPNFFKEYAPKLIEFFDSFLIYLQKNGNSYNLIDKLRDNHDIDLALDNFLEIKKTELMSQFPSTLSADIRILMKILIKFYISKGSLESYKFLFRSFYNEDVKLSYPKENVLRLSDGKWSQPLYIKIKEIITDIEYAQLENYSVEGMTSGATGNNISAQPNEFADGQKYMSLIINNHLGYFLENETIKLTKKDFSEYNDEKYFTVDKFILSEGAYTNTDGLLSVDRVMQDSYYYQDFSYVITSKVPIDEYRDIIKNFIHPAGFLFFGTVIYYTDEDVMNMPLMTFLRFWVIQWINVLNIDCRNEFLTNWNINHASFNKVISNGITLDWHMQGGASSFFIPDAYYINDMYDFTQKTTSSSVMFFNNGNFINPLDIDYLYQNISFDNHIKNLVSLKITPSTPYLLQTTEKNIIDIKNYEKEQIGTTTFIYNNETKTKFINSSIVLTDTGFDIPPLNENTNITIFSTNDIIEIQEIKNISGENLTFDLHHNIDKIIPFVNGICVYDKFKKLDKQYILYMNIDINDIIEFYIFNNENSIMLTDWNEYNKINNLVLFDSCIYHKLYTIDTSYETLFYNPMDVININGTNNRINYLNLDDLEMFKHANINNIEFVNYHNYAETLDRLYVNENLFLMEGKFIDMTPIEIENGKNYSSIIFFEINNNEYNFIDPADVSYSTIIRFNTDNNIIGIRFNPKCPVLRMNDYTQVFKSFEIEGTPIIFNNGLKIKNSDIIIDNGRLTLENTAPGNSVLFFADNILLSEYVFSKNEFEISQKEVITFVNGKLNLDFTLNDNKLIYNDTPLVGSIIEIIEFNPDLRYTAISEIYNNNKKRNINNIKENAFMQ